MALVRLDTASPMGRGLPGPRRANWRLAAPGASGNIVTGLGAGWVRVGATDYRENLVLTPESVALGWAPAGFDGLAEADFAQLLAHKPEVVLFGTGHGSNDIDEEIRQMRAILSFLERYVPGVRAT